MTYDSSIDMKTPWCAACKGYTQHTTHSAGEDGNINICDECGKQMWSASHSKTSILIAKIFFPILLIPIIGVPFYIGFPPLISSSYITACLLATAITYRVGFYKYPKHLRAFNDWARREALSKSED